MSNTTKPAGPAGPGYGLPEVRLGLLAGGQRGRATGPLSALRGGQLQTPRARLELCGGGEKPTPGLGGQRRVLEDPGQRTPSTLHSSGPGLWDFKLSFSQRTGRTSILAIFF